MPRVILVSNALTVNGSSCKKVTVSQQAPGEDSGVIEIDFMLTHGKYTTIEITREDLAKIVSAANEGGVSAGPNILAE